MAEPPAPALRPVYGSVYSALLPRREVVASWAHLAAQQVTLIVIERTALELHVPKRRVLQRRAHPHFAAHLGWVSSEVSQTGRQARRANSRYAADDEPQRAGDGQTPERQIAVTECINRHDWLGIREWLPVPVGGVVEQRPDGHEGPSAAHDGHNGADDAEHVQHQSCFDDQQYNDEPAVVQQVQDEVNHWFLSL